MILWTIKLLSNVRNAIAGRNHPHQLAWAVAFGLVLGVVPHGNLVAVAWLLIVLSLNINHSMVAVTAIGSSFLAGRLDPYSHRAGDFLLNQPKVHQALMTAWQWPLVPWTNLNNTVVLGSFIIAVLAMLPVVVVTYPVFRFLGRKFKAAEAKPVVKKKSRRQRSRIARAVEAPTHAIVVVDQAHPIIERPHRSPGHVSIDEPRREDKMALSVADFTPVQTPETPSPTVAMTSPSSDAVSGASTSTHQTERATSKLPAEVNRPSEPPIAIETRIDVIRISDYRETGKQESLNHSGDNGVADDSEPMDEAFRYLLHQLRDTQQRKAA